MRLGWLLSRRLFGRIPKDGEESKESPDEPVLDISDIRSLGFWISNGLMIAATIFGVYLAASEGFKQAMLFRQVEEQEHTYDLLTALRAEVVRNREIVGAATEKGLEELPQSWEEPPAIQRFVWQTMQNVPETFRVPPQALNGIAIYYEALDEYLPTAFNSSTHRSTQYSAFKALAEANAAFDKDVIATIGAKMAKLQSALADYGVDPKE